MLKALREGMSNPDYGLDSTAALLRLVMEPISVGKVPFNRFSPRCKSVSKEKQEEEKGDNVSGNEAKRDTVVFPYM